MPAASTSFSSKLSAVGMPVGRLFRCQARAIAHLLLLPADAVGRVASCTARTTDTKDPAVKGNTAGSDSLRAVGAQLTTALAVGALEASIEHARSHLALVLALEECAAAALVAPAIAGLIGRAIEDHPIALDPVDVRAAQRVVDTAAFRIRLGQDDAIACNLVDGPDMLVVIADHFHMLADLAEQAPLLLRRSRQPPKSLSNFD